MSGWPVLPLVVVLLVLGAVGAGAVRWRLATRNLHARLEAGRRAVGPTTFDAECLAGLPPPVGRYLQLVLTPGQPMVSGVRMEHRGTFNLATDGQRWRPFTATQWAVTRRPGFLWDARIDMAPGFAVRVHDAYLAGDGILHASLLGLLPVADLRGTPEMACGELMRLVAEAPWYPTILLPGDHLSWQEVDVTSARAIFRDGALEVTLVFRFNEEGLIAAVRTENRPRAVGKQVEPSPWEGRWWGYEVHQGMRIPTAGEVAWLLPAGPHPYWRGRLTRYEATF